METSKLKGLNIRYKWSVVEMKHSTHLNLLININIIEHPPSQEGKIVETFGLEHKAGCKDNISLGI